MVKIIGNNTPALKKGDPEPPLAPGRARIYSMRFCPWAERAVLYAAAKGIDVEIVNINLVEKPEWYFNKHPQGKVPTFEKDGQIVIESGIIPEYLDGIYPESAILPTDPYLRAKQRILLEQAAPLTTAFYGLFAVYRENLEGEARDAKIKPVEDAIDNIEKLLKDEYFGGSTPGFADWLLFPFFERVSLLSTPLSLPSPFPSSRWPNLSSWWGRISSLPAAAAALQPKEVHLAFVKSFIGGKADYDVGL
ncbi:gsto-1 [Pristionchus pacificus]|uniref:Glutathione S-transferase omega n=1 Tax=Pristionchus pacificus TaxID=54126 RepID=A0A454XPG9_PRIPA|nr:gsto-1 [Pristionchus pacificus]|eukprot:PDM62674.1 gsto-1 [Pristionchus pacificus]